MATQTATELQALEPPTAPSGPASRKDHEARATGPGVPPAAAPALPGRGSRGRVVLAVAQVCGLTFLSSFCNGVVVVALPAVQAALPGLRGSLSVWPTSGYYLAAGSCLLLAGSVADVAGPKRVNLVGSFLSAAFALACGLARTGGEMVAFRALQGVTNAIVTPSSISIISGSAEEGRPRNVGFGCLGFSQPLGFSFGLVLAGVFTDTVGWRPAFYLAAATSFTLFLVSIWALPQDTPPEGGGQSLWRRVASEIDWLGLLLASLGLATLSYVLA